ncbi:MAG: type IV toxin-antitoxin system AbiEi family antitoxin domain-containing protein [Anaerovoracaceae bacterium]|jgi:predicted transcriptional regulator of viral defense system
MNEKIMNFIAENNGMISTNEAKENNISLKRLERLEKSGELERVAHGLYLHKDYILDPFYLLQYRSSKIVFSHNTALYLHKLSDENPSILTMTVPSGWNSPLIKEDKSYKFYYYKEEIWEIGQEKINSPYGHKINIYDKERTLCDSIINIDELGRDLVINAIKEYMTNTKNRDIEKLYKYAEILNTKEKVRTYVEVFYEV